jgi:glycosyltransferase involved in cell wall biosynthesis
VVAAAAGGALELVEADLTGWLTKPGDIHELANAIRSCYGQRHLAQGLSQAAQIQAADRFQQSRIQQQIAELLGRCQADMALVP